MTSREQQIAEIQKDWDTNPRWIGIKRSYSAADVVNLRGSIQVEHTLAKNGSIKLWDLVKNQSFVNALGAMTGNQAMQQVKAGLKAIYLSGWQVAGDANSGYSPRAAMLYPAALRPAGVGWSPVNGGAVDVSVSTDGGTQTY